MHNSESSGYLKYVIAEYFLLIEKALIIPFIFHSVQFSKCELKISTITYFMFFE